MAFKQTKKYAYDEIVKARQSMNKTTWLRFLTDFQLLPNLVSLSEATYVFTKNNFSLSPGKWDLREGGSTTVVSCSTSSRWLVGGCSMVVCCMLSLANTDSSPIFSPHATLNATCHMTRRT